MRPRPSLLILLGVILTLAEGRPIGSESEAERSKRGWLLGNGSQEGNGCHGILGVVGMILGNRKACGADDSQDTVTLIGSNGGAVDPNLSPYGYPGGAAPPGAFVGAPVDPSQAQYAGTPGISQQYGAPPPGYPGR